MTKVVQAKHKYTDILLEGETLDTMCKKLRLPKSIKVPQSYMLIKNGNNKITTAGISKESKNLLIEIVGFWNKQNPSRKYEIKEVTRYNYNKRIIAKHLRKLFGVQSVELNPKGMSKNRKVPFLRVTFTDEVALSQVRVQQILSTLKLAGVNSKTAGFCTMTCYKM